MKFILKLLLAPLMLVLWIVEWALTLALKASAVVCVIASALFLLSGFFYFVDGNVQNGCICLGIAFLLSPYGLHYLAVKLTARFIGMRILSGRESTDKRNMRNVKRRRLPPASFSMEGIWRPHESYPCT